MLIAFEGPDNTGKSTSANALSSDGQAVHDISKHNYNIMAKDYGQEQGTVGTIDRIDWFSHTVYRLALPEHEWNDARIRTVFALPEAHLVVKVHSPELAGLIQDELYTEGKVAQVNPVYEDLAYFFARLNHRRGYTMFKTVSIMEVHNNPAAGTFRQELVYFDSPVDSSYVWSNVDSDEKLLDMLLDNDNKRA